MKRTCTSLSQFTVEQRDTKESQVKSNDQRKYDKISLEIFMMPIS